MKFVFKIENNMKKIYMTPEMEIVEIKVQQMLTTSLPTGSTPTDPATSDAPEYSWEGF